jgi:hypothetical protein
MVISRRLDRAVSVAGRLAANQLQVESRVASLNHKERQIIRKSREQEIAKEHARSAFEKAGVVEGHIPTSATM